MFNELRELGWNENWERLFRQGGSAGELPARISAESQGLYRALGPALGMPAGGAGVEYLAELSGRLRFEAGGRGDLPAVGDWVALRPRPEGRATIVRILPRRSLLARKAAGRNMDAQLLAANLDLVFVVTSLNQEWSPRRLERYLAVAWESGAQPVLVLSKADLAADLGDARSEAERLAPGAPVLAVSAVNAVNAVNAALGAGLAPLRALLEPCRTGAFVGSSGVGKSTLINLLGGAVPQTVGAIRAADDRGRHTTTARQLLVLPGGGVVIDTPGMRELQLWESDAGLARAFDDLESLAARCRFADCRHRGEPGCAVEEAVAEGTLPEERLESHRKLERELRALAARADPRARHEEKSRIKALCKAAKRHSKRS